MYAVYTLAALLSPFVLALVINRPSGKYQMAPRITWMGFILNVILWPWMKAGVKMFRPISLSGLLKATSKKMKLDDFGDTFYQKNYMFCIEEFNKTNYTPVGHQATKSQLASKLIARLQVVDKIKKNPEIAKIQLQSPIIVMGMPRTGTTFLHRLLSLDPKGRCPQTWELTFPVHDDSNKKKLIKKVTAEFDQIDKICPHMKVIHELGAELPEECLTSLSQDIPMLPCTFDIMCSDGGKDLVIGSDTTMAYANYKKVLQILTEQGKSHDKHWVLKSPVHIPFMSACAKVFPDAKYIWTHRKTESAFGSFCSFLHTFQEIHIWGPIDLASIGDKVMSFWGDALKHAQKVCEKTGVDVQHVKYDDTISQPKQVVKDIYAHFKMDYTDEYDQLIDEYLAKIKKERAEQKKQFGDKHKYSTAMYGISEERMAELDWYTKAYL